MITIQCETCGRECQVKGSCTSDTNFEPGEIILDDTDDWSQCCVCLRDGANYIVLKYEEKYYEC